MASEKDNNVDSSFHDHTIDTETFQKNTVQEALKGYDGGKSIKFRRKAGKKWD